MREIEALSDAELRAELQQYNFNAGPVTGTTRSVYEKKLAKLRLAGPSEPKASLNETSAKSRTKSPSRSAANKSIVKRNNQKSENEEASDNDIEIISPKVNRTASSTKPVVSTPKKNRTPSPGPIPPPSSRSKRNLNASVSRSGKEAASVRTALPLEPDSSPKSSRNISRTLTPPRKANSSKIIGDRPGGTPPRGSTTSTWASRSILEESGPNISSRNMLELGNTTAEESDGEPLETSRVFHNVKKTYPKAWSVLGRNTETPVHPKRELKRKAASVGKDVSTILMIVLSVFFLLLGMAYVATARKEVLLGTVNILATTTRDTIGFFYTYAVLPVALVAGAALLIVALFFMYKRVQENQLKEEEIYQNLVEKIMEYVRDSAADGDEFISVPHVRDVIFPPAKRTNSQLNIWNRAVAFLDSSESRISTETRVIHGQECAVWRWLPYKKTGWQGNALNTMNSPSSPLSPSSAPAYALTRSLKVREVFDNKLGEAVDFAAIRRDFMEKIYPVRPLHVGFGTETPEGVVFLKLSSLEDAKDAFTSLHSTWYNGRLLRVKYIRDSRYDERFPQAIAH